MEKQQKVIVFEDHDQLSDFAIRKWCEVARGAIQARGRFTVALSGGKTPINFYRRLSQASDDLPWAKTHIFLVDERFVSHCHQDSNYRVIHEQLLSRVPIPQKNIHPVPTDKTDIRTSVRCYEHHLREFFCLDEGAFPRFDLVTLGVGQDGHTASLFPASDALQEQSRLVVDVSDDTIKIPRISMSLPLINKSSLVIFLVTGSHKANILKEVLKKDGSLPASMVRPYKGVPLFLLDRDAASHLTI